MMMSLRSRTAMGTAAAVLFVLATSPAQAQFNFNFGSVARSATAESQTNAGCPKGKKKSAGAAIFGNIAGQMAGQAAGKYASFVPIPEVADMLTNAIACKLDKDEQKQAAEATLQATRVDEKTGEVPVGATAEWTSATREGVSGKSTVIARNDIDASGLQCITVTDVIIVSGEETTANKRMCKPEGGTRYSLMA